MQLFGAGEQQMQNVFQMIDQNCISLINKINTYFSFNYISSRLSIHF